MGSINSNIKPKITGDPDLFKLINDNIERISDTGFIKIEIYSVGGDCFLSGLFKKQQVLDTFLVGYSNKYMDTLDMVDRFNLYDIYSNLPKDDLIRYLIYSIYYLDTLEVSNTEGKVRLSINSIDNTNILICS